MVIACHSSAGSAFTLASTVGPSHHLQPLLVPRSTSEESTHLLFVIWWSGAQHAPSQPSATAESAHMRLGGLAQHPSPR